ncbi:MAG: VWA domain-containing protein [Methanobrevibacter thaueri]|uniref:VWA domain-containing protein n=1 Tax=Methanobrevibacter thaueri TaxID=190975 RepID=A0A8T3VHI8_9EURY|nr:vWA domain-containing protein [Methanobrevibacter thaueri]MBE6502138.1 VWA domain-containing protein [Methanobrevibacter thaueri]
MKETPSTENLDLIFVMDRSGSMGGSESDTIGGFNSFIEREKEKSLNTRVTTVLFDDQYEVLYKRKAIGEVAELTKNEYWVRGCTALLDAIGRTINTLDKEIDNKVLFVIMTDGLENASREFSKEQIRNLISSHNWEFIYIGANIDSYTEAGRIGIQRSHTANYKKSRRGFDDVYRSVNDAADSLRCNMDLKKAGWNKRLKKYDD